jgi:hypothetical protein
MNGGRQVGTNSKVSSAIPKVNGTNAQFRYRGILFAPANGKLYFAFLKIFSVPENTCPCRGQKHSEVVFFKMWNVNY